jgi:hypothetical protein
MPPTVEASVTCAGTPAVGCRDEQSGALVLHTVGMRQEEVFDNPTGWVNKHIRGYVASDGKRGHRWNGVNTLLLTTRGRKSGTLRRTALIYGRDGDRYLVVGSRGGAQQHPAWYLNLVANPEVAV